MIFVSKDKLKVGMRLARPIYNKNGVLLYERDSKLTIQGIESIKNFGLIGIFVLEPAEPVPPMTKEDIEFERFQSMMVFSIKNELDNMMQKGRTDKIDAVATDIIRSYGRQTEPINFFQTLRSKDDHLYKHTLNVAILCALIAHTLKVSPQEQLEAVKAAIANGVVHHGVDPEILEKESRTKDEDVTVKTAQNKGYDRLENVFPTQPNIRRIAMQTAVIIDSARNNTKLENMKQVTGTRILAVAETFDMMTAMHFGRAPESDVKALRFLLDHEEQFNPKVVDALVKSINILVPGISVELSTGDKAIVITENRFDVLKPVVLTFRDNAVMDLSDYQVYGDVEITDIMKTMDNRYIMDFDFLRAHGYDVKSPDYV